MIHISIVDDQLVLQVESDDLAPSHESQLAYWGFRLDVDRQRFVRVAADHCELAQKVTRYLTRQGCAFSLEGSVNSLLKRAQRAKTALATSLNKGRALKNGSYDNEESRSFLNFLKHGIPRPLKDHQCKAAMHLLAVKNGANFSVPGSGKTAVVLSVFRWLRETKAIDALFVVGPPACFGPWQDEYKQTLGESPATQLLAGGDVDERRGRYQANRESVRDLYLTTFHTLHRDWQYVQTLFSRQGVRFFLVIDEAHYIKQPDGAWAKAALTAARSAERRCILTGTPFPKGYTDAFNLFDALSPNQPPIPTLDKRKIAFQTKQRNFDEASQLLEDCIGPLFYRVRKADLDLAPQIFEEPTYVKMNACEQHVYDAILDRIQLASQSDYCRDIDVLLRLRRGRMIRLRQCLSYTHLLQTALNEYQEVLFEDDQSISNIIRHYNELETPGKIQALVEMLPVILTHGGKVVIWSNFVKTLELIHRTVLSLGYGARLIYGATPLESNTSLPEETTREQAIQEFVSQQSGIDVLIANPAACAESISLHKTCSHAIYYDLSYNCAQYLQSLDRIHRVGGSEDKPSYYHFLQYQNSLDEDILSNVRGKAERMNCIIDRDYPIYSLDMFDIDDELAAYDRLFKKPT